MLLILQPPEVTITRLACRLDDFRCGGQSIAERASVCRFCEQLLKQNGLSAHEKHLLLEMTGCMTEMLLDWKEEGQP